MSTRRYISKNNYTHMQDPVIGYVQYTTRFVIALINITCLFTYAHTCVLLRTQERYTAVNKCVGL